MYLAFYCKIKGYYYFFNAGIFVSVKTPIVQWNKNVLPFSLVPDFYVGWNEVTSVLETEKKSL